MNIIAEVEKKTSTRSETKSFDDALARSRPLTDYCVRTLCKLAHPKVYICDRYDSTAYKSSSGSFRPPDLQIEDRRGKNPVFKFVEAKFFGVLVYFNGTGLSRGYVETILMPYGAENVYLVWEETPLTIGERLSKNKAISRFAKPYVTGDKISELVSNKIIAEDSHGKKYGEYLVAPYGERLDILMQNRFPEEVEKRVPCEFKHTKKYGSLQYIWRDSCMNFLSEIIKRDFSKANINKE